MFFLTHWKVMVSLCLVVALTANAVVSRVQLAGCRADLAESRAQVTVLAATHET